MYVEISVHVHLLLISFSHITLSRLSLSIWITYPYITKPLCLIRALLNNVETPVTESVLLQTQFWEFYLFIYFVSPVILRLPRFGADIFSSEIIRSYETTFFKIKSFYPLHENRYVCEMDNFVHSKSKLAHREGKFCYFKLLKIWLVGSVWSQWNIKLYPINMYFVYML